RFKKDIEDEVGQHFKERRTEARTVQASTAEEKCLTRIKGLKFHTLNRKSPGQDRDILFSTTLLKAFLSSPHACLETVQNRLQSITARLEQSPPKKIKQDLEDDFQTLDMFKGHL